jgi:signal transduction histidine kinase
MRVANNTIKIAGWAKRYRTALRKNISHDPGTDLRPALKLGGEARDLGLETLDLALIHVQALSSMIAPECPAADRKKTIGRAKRFFVETTIPLDRTHRAALKADVRVGQLTRALRRRTAESTASTRNLNQGIAKRQAAEAAVAKSGKHRIHLLEESVRLQKLLRDRKRAILLAQEAERRENSRQLRDDISQLLLAINFKLMTLKAAVKANTNKLKKEIAETQSLVQESENMLLRFTRKPSKPP